jgi:hypothetical protein
MREALQGSVQPTAGGGEDGGWTAALARLGLVVAFVVGMAIVVGMMCRPKLSATWAPQRSALSPLKVSST